MELELVCCCRVGFMWLLSYNMLRFYLVYCEETRIEEYRVKTYHTQ